MLQATVLLKKGLSHNTNALVADQEFPAGSEGSAYGCTGACLTEEGLAGEGVVLVAEPG